MEEEPASDWAPADRLPPAFAGENRKCRHRLRIVGSNAYGCVVNSSRIVWLGGSSSVFRKMFAAVGFIRSASWIIAIFSREMIAVFCTLAISSRVAGAV